MILASTDYRKSISANLSMILKVAMVCATTRNEVCRRRAEVDDMEKEERWSVRRGWSCVCDFFLASIPFFY